MILHVEPGQIAGRVEIPGSKSHTIRALLIAALAEGVSEIGKPLDSADTRAALETCRALGACIETTNDLWRVEGTSGAVVVPENIIDVGNSGTTLYVALGTAALAEGFTVFTGDAQIRRRPVEALLGALRELGAEAFSTRGNGCAPVIVRGPLTGGGGSWTTTTTSCGRGWEGCWTAWASPTPSCCGSPIRATSRSSATSAGESSPTAAWTTSSTAPTCRQACAPASAI